MPTNRRWQCPQCAGTVTAPERPRRDDVRRYCLDCSASTGRLVARTCPALDRQRAARKQAAQQRTSTQRARQRAAEAAHWTAGGVDLRTEARELWRLMGGRADRLPQITLRRSATKWYATGRAYYSERRVVITLPSANAGKDGMSRDAYHAATACWVLAHELAHIKAGAWHAHDEKWAAVYVDAVKARYGQRRDWHRDSDGPRPASGYAVDGWVRPKMMRVWAAQYPLPALPATAAGA